MSVTATKKKKLFQIAKELNLATETIKEFLEKKGVKVRNPNMRISGEDYEAILERFSFEKKEADKIHRRREERIREEEEEAVKKAETEAEAEVEATPESEDGDTPEAETEAAETTETPDDAEAESEAADADDAADEAPEAETEAAETETEETPPESDEAAESGESDDSPAETPAADEPTEETALVDAPPVDEQPQESADTEAETEETEATEAPAEQDADPTEEKPQVGDIIDHPIARQYLERKAREAQVKEDKKQGKADPKSSDAEGGDEERGRKGKKGKKKDRREIQEEKDARRRKAFEMLKRESKRIRPQMVPMDDESGSDAPKEKEGRRRKKRKKKEVDQKEVDSALKKTLAEIRDAGTGTGRKKRKKIRSAEDEETEEISVIKVTEFITTQDLANLLDVPASEIIRKCLELGLVVTINQRLDMDTIRLLAEEFDHEVEEEEEFGSDYLEDIADDEDDEANLKPRPPVVTIMGHVDHGKTSLLDYIREANVVEGESGGITQHIGAYEVTLKENRKITFLDTPGHEAFTAMRARGAQVTDIVVLVIAADDRVMPQTEEALDHARAAGVSIVIAINKIDRPAANSENIKKQLADRNVLVEDWGGSFQCVEVSAKTGQNVPDLLEKILLEAELLDLKANPDKRARGVVLEAQLDKGRGPVATLLVEAGTLRVGDSFIVGQNSARVRAMFNERGNRVEVAGPSSPVLVLGVDGIPEAGDRFLAMEDEKAVREVAQRRQQLKREQDFRQVRLMTLDELSEQIQTGIVKELKLIVKADVDGSAQALTDSLLKISNEEVEVQVIRKAVGPITESDIILAAASQAIIIGFHVRPTIKAKELAEREHVDIRQYKVIYNAIEDIENALEGMLAPIAREVVTGTIEIREVFKISRIGSVAGCYVLSGKVTRNSNVRLVRNDVELYDGKLSSLKRFKDDVREVQSGYECGLTIENFNDIKVGDIVEAYEIVHEAQTLKRSGSGRGN